MVFKVLVMDVVVKGDVMERRCGFRIKFRIFKYFLGSELRVSKGDWKKGKL